MFRALYSILFIFWLSLAVSSLAPAATLAANNSSEALPVSDADSKTKKTTSDELPSITVLADRALTIPLTRLASEYSRRHHVSITVTFAPSFEQTLAIEEGAPADLFISAHPEALRQLKQQGLFDVYSITPLIKSKFALITSTDYPDKISTVTLDSIKQMKKLPSFLISIANKAATAEGYYTAQILNHIRSKIFLSSNIAELQNTEDIISFNRKTPAFGILFESDALQLSDLKTLGSFPEEWHEEAIFTGVVVAGSNMDNARAFLDYLDSAEAQRQFVGYRFYPVTKKTANQ